MQKFGNFAPFRAWDLDPLNPETQTPETGPQRPGPRPQIPGPKKGILAKNRNPKKKGILRQKIGSLAKKRNPETKNRLIGKKRNTSRKLACIK